MVTALEGMQHLTKQSSGNERAPRPAEIMMKAPGIFVAFLMVLAVAATGCSRDKGTHGNNTSSSDSSGGY
jgi:hypothetical protein